jgi:hypothetical protein
MSAEGPIVMNEPLYLTAFNTIAGETVWTECLYAYIPV